MGIEQGRPRSNAELDLEYPGLKGAINRVSKVVLSEFRPLRSDVDKVKPPLLICEDEILRQDVERTMRKTTREDKPEERGHIQFEAISGVIFGSDKFLKELLSKGKKGFQTLTAALAEEYIHALTTVADEDSTRVGFLNIPHRQTGHLLEPGKIYEHRDLKVRDQDSPVFVEDPREIRLTENLTHLAVTLMLNKLFQDPERKFGYFSLTNQNANMVVIGEANDELLKLVLRSLFMGDENIIEQYPNGKDILQVLEIPETTVFAISKFPPNVKDLYNYSSDPDITLPQLS